MIEIKNKFTGEVICKGETIREAVTANFADLGGANLCGANLRGANLGDADIGDADLGGANLCGANLGGADLCGANLGDANLGGANLRGAYLGGANLCDANLGGANLRGAYLGGANLGDADLGGANLCGAYLGGANISWSSHDLLAELLKRSSGDDVAKLKVAGLLLVCREKCWQDFLGMRDPLAGWALGVLREWIVDDDGHPAILDTFDKGGES